jgi:hypothetical protein
VERDPTLVGDLESLVEPVTRGDPESPLRWTCKSKDNLAAELREMGHKVSATKVGRLLHELDYSLQVVRKTREGKQSPDRNEQFEHINRTAKAFMKRGQPVVSVDTKKKELVGDFKNAGREWQPKGEPEPVRVHDFIALSTLRERKSSVRKCHRSMLQMSLVDSPIGPAWWLT